MSLYGPLASPAGFPPLLYWFAATAPYWAALLGGLLVLLLALVMVVIEWTE